MTTSIDSSTVPYHRTHQHYGDQYQEEEHHQQQEQSNTSSSHPPHNRGRCRMFSFLVVHFLLVLSIYNSTMVGSAKESSQAFTTSAINPIVNLSNVLVSNLLPSSSAAAVEKSPPKPAAAPAHSHDWILPSGHVRPSNSSLLSSLWPQYPTKLGPWEPLLHKRYSDGQPFILILMVDQVEWMDLCVNFIYTLRQNGIFNVTISTTSPEVLEVASMLNLSTYSAAQGIRQAPDYFAPLPHWSWGKHAWLRVATTLHALRQGVGSCQFDVDTAITSDVFFSHPDGPFDLVIQGRELPSVNKSNSCPMSWQLDAQGTKGKMYINPGFGCYAPNERTAKLFHSYIEQVARSIKEKVHGWLQPAFNVAACLGDIQVSNCTTIECKAVMKKYDNASMLIFKAVSENDNATLGTTRMYHAVHSKGCHGAGRNAANGATSDVRHQCKIETLKHHNSWHVPFDLPTDTKGWQDEAILIKVRDFLYYGKS
jgi:hypothetical protein